MILLPCPSCGAQVPFRSKVTVYAVCEYCNSTVIREDVDLKLLGEMAALQEDYSVLQRGTTGTYDGKEFSLIGRVHYEWERGGWSEWFLFFPDNSFPQGAWLAEAQGFYAVSFLEPNVTDIPPLNKLKPGSVVELKSAPFTVTDIKKSTVAFSEGELPFVAEKGAPRSSVDLSGNNDWFASLEYFETESSVYIGRYSTFTELGLQNVKALDGWS